MTAPLWLAFGRLRNGPAYGADAWCWKLGQRWENLWKDVQGPEPCGSYLRSPSAVLRSIVSWWYASGHARVACSCYFISVHPIPFHHPPPLRQAIMRIYAQREIRSQQEMINHHCCYPKKWSGHISGRWGGLPMTSMKIPMPGQLLQLHLQDEYFPRLTIQYINLGIEGAVRHALKKTWKIHKMCVSNAATAAYQY